MKKYVVYRLRLEFCKHVILFTIAFNSYFLQSRIDVSVTNIAAGTQLNWFFLDHSFQGAFNPGILSNFDLGVEGICLRYPTGLSAPNGDPIFQTDIHVYSSTE